MKINLTLKKFKNNDTIIRTGDYVIVTSITHPWFEQPGKKNLQEWFAQFNLKIGSIARVKGIGTSIDDYPIQITLNVNDGSPFVPIDCVRKASIDEVKNSIGYKVSKNKYKA